MYGITYKMIIKMALSLLLAIVIIVASVGLFAMMANEIYGCDEATQGVAGMEFPTVEATIEPLPRVCLPETESAENTAKIEPTEVIVEEPVTEAATEPAVVEPELEYIPFDCTAYCPCVSCSGEYGCMTSTGTIATAGRTIAVDPTFIPYGTEVIIEGMDGTYLAEDCGGLIKGKNRIDIFFDSHEEARAFGRKTLNVAVIG